MKMYNITDRKNIFYAQDNKKQHTLNAQISVCFINRCLTNFFRGKYEMKVIHFCSQGLETELE